MSGRPFRVTLGHGPPPAAVVAQLDADGPVGVLSGRWFGGGAVILTDPVRTHAPDRAEDVFDLLDQQPLLDPDEHPGERPDLLGGGWLACLGYAPGHCWAGFFDHLWRYRPESGWSVESLGVPGRAAVVEASVAALRELLAAEPSVPSPPRLHAPFTADPNAPTTHLRGVESVIAGIERGDFYQLNLCTRLRNRIAPGSARRLFAAATDRLRPAYGALIDLGDDRAIVSLSPELFLAEHAGRVRTAPIKGTSPVEADPTGAVLAASAKDAAENVMITDLMRNDVSQVCRPGTVTVERLLELERHPGVWHLVSTVTGQLDPGAGPSDLLRATYPPGSVTGAPKRAAMTGIAATETHDRGAYTGALGFVSPVGGAEFSVVIRTFEIDGDAVELGVGGGITVDSVPVREWYECLHKAEPLVAAIGGELAPELRVPPPPIPDRLLAAGLIETLLAHDGEPVRPAAHLARLDRSVRELYGSGLPPDLPERLRHAAAGQRGRQRIRILARPTAAGLDIVVETHPAGTAPPSIRLVCGERPAWCWRHKWADRSALAEPVQTDPAVLTLPYYLTPDGRIAETSRGNLVLRRADGVWVSPPESEHVLPGITRRDLLRDLLRAGERVRVDDLSPGELEDAAEILHCSSIAGVVPVTAIEG